MKRVLFFMFVIAVAYIIYTTYGSTIVGLLNRILYYSPCDTPLHYRLGQIDERFHLTTSQLQVDVNQAASLWNQAKGKKLFIRDDSAQLHINLVYDERQQLKNQIDELGNTLGQEKGTLSQQESQFESMSASFQNQLNDFNRKVQYWNSRGGAPKDEYQKLMTEQEELKQQSTQLKALADKLNRSGEGYNGQIDVLNQTIDSFNQKIGVHPEEGVYDQNDQRIDIYFNVNRNELIHTLAHELGHALGLEHVTNSDSIMYPQTSQTLNATKEDINAIQTVCARKTIFEIFFTRLGVRLKMLQEKIIPMLQQLLLQLHLSPN